MSRSWEIGIRLREQCTRLGLPCIIAEKPPQSTVERSMLESAIQEAAKTLSDFIGERPSTLEDLVWIAENFGHGYRRLGPWPE